MNSKHSLSSPRPVSAFRGGSVRAVLGPLIAGSVALGVGGLPACADRFRMREAEVEARLSRVETSVAALAEAGPGGRSDLPSASARKGDPMPLTQADHVPFAELG